jgi:hypothetical protein
MAELASVKASNDHEINDWYSSRSGRAGPSNTRHGRRICWRRLLFGRQSVRDSRVVSLPRGKRDLEMTHTYYASVIVDSKVYGLCVDAATSFEDAFSQATLAAERKFPRSDVQVQFVQLMSVPVSQTA